MGDQKSVLITGGTGAIGQAFVAHCLARRPDFARMTVFSRDEHKQSEMQRAFANHGDRLKYAIGDMRDAARLEEVTRGMDVIVHAAAMKHVPVAESNPYEAVRSNVEGAMNLVRAAQRNGVARVVALSSDKAVEPTTVYGATKLIMERLLIAADANGPTRFSVVRYANVFGSRGSVVPYFLSRRSTGVLPITDPRMTRFSITMREGVALIVFALDKGRGGEIVAPIAPSYRVGDVAIAIAPEAQHEVIGPRPGEKTHEAMFSMAEASFVARRGKYYVVTPQGGRWSLGDYCDEEADASPLEAMFEYESGSNQTWLGVDEIRNLIRNELDVE